MRQQSRELSESPESTNWLASQEQQFWFDRFALKDDSREDVDGNTDVSKLGLKFNQFQEFLKATLYNYFEKFPHSLKQQQQQQQLQLAHVNNDENGTTSGHGHETTANDLTGPMSRVDLEVGQFTKQQEMHLFKRFDQKNDHMIDRDDFAQLCQKWLHKVFNPTCALLVVDVQNDFIDGSLALINGPARQDGADVVPVVNDLINTCLRHEVTVIYTQDWHPANHISFHDNLYLRKYMLKEDKSRVALETSDEKTVALRKEMEEKTDEKINNNNNNNNKSNGAGVLTSDAGNHELKYKKFATKVNVFDTVLFDEGRTEQKLWPIHCIKNSWGAQLHPKLKVVPDAIKIQKGTLSHVDAYSAFWDNMRSNETGLRQELALKGVTDLFVCGLALDYCVAASALDAAKAGFITFVVDDACRGIDLGEIEKRKQELRDRGAFIVQSDVLDNYLKRRDLDRSLVKTITYLKAFS